MNYKKIIFNIFFLPILFFGVFGLAKNIWAAAINVASCNLSDVQNAVNNAQRGDTVFVPAGACNWSERLFIRKAIKLYGAGANDSGTRITVTQGDTNTYWSDEARVCEINFGEAAGQKASIVYQVYDASLDENEIFEVKGFKFIQSSALNSVGGLLIINGDKDTFINKIMIHDNEFRWRMDTSASRYSPFIGVWGRVHGVFYKNVGYARKPYMWYSGGGRFDDGNISNGCTYQDQGAYQWRDDIDYEPGTDKAWVIEDNIFNFSTTDPEHMGGTSKGSEAMVVRYNTYNNQDPTAHRSQNGHDAHGSYPSGYSPMGFEVYGNYYTGQTVCTINNTLPECEGGSLGVTFLHTRAGRNYIFNNLVQNSAGNGNIGASIQLKRACNECSSSFNADTGNTCSNMTFSQCNGRNVCSAKNHPMYIHDTYIWQNRRGNAGTTLVNSVSVSGEGSDLECSEWDSTGTKCLAVKSVTPCACTEYGTFYGLSVCTKRDGAYWYPEQLPRENTEWWKDNTSCTSLSCPNTIAGVGCGSKLPTGACRSGNAFWVTSQSCSALTASEVGATTDNNWNNKRRSGALYKCVNGSWQTTPFYTPLTYPHPLRSETPGNTAPAAPTGVRVI